MFLNPIGKLKEDSFLIFNQKEFFVPELGKFVQLKVSVTALKTIDRLGLMPYLKKQGLKLSDIQ